MKYVFIAMIGLLFSSFCLAKGEGLYVCNSGIALSPAPVLNSLNCDTAKPFTVNRLSNGLMEACCVQK